MRVKLHVQPISNFEHQRLDWIRSSHATHSTTPHQKGIMKTDHLYYLCIYLQVILQSQ